MMGKPVVVGTRITVELILERLAAGESIAEGPRDGPFGSRSQAQCPHDLA